MTEFNPEGPRLNPDKPLHLRGFAGEPLKNHEHVDEANDKSWVKILELSANGDYEKAGEEFKEWLKKESQNKKSDK